MEKPMNVCVLVGSLRKASINGMLANALISLAPSSLKLEIVEIGNCPFSIRDLETGSSPAQWTARSASASRLLTRCCSSRPNITARCRPFSRMHWMSAPGRMEAASGTASPARIVSGSPSAIGAFGANHHLRQSLVFLNVPTMQQPEAYVGHATSSSMNMASSSATGPANSCRISCRRSRTGSRRFDLKAGASDGLRQARATTVIPTANADAQETGYRYCRQRTGVGHEVTENVHYMASRMGVIGFTRVLGGAPP